MPTSMAEQKVFKPLSEYQWEKRLIILSADRSADELVAQLEMFSGQEDIMAERDLVVIQISDDMAIPLFGDDKAPSASEMIGALTIDVADPFKLLLVGKDGGVKLRASEPIPAQQIFDLIDAMPMRALEMQQ